MNKQWTVLIAGMLAFAGAAHGDGKPDISKVDVSKLPPAAKTTGLTFTKDIQPMLEKSCTRCHGQDRPKANLRLDNLEAALKGGKDGKVIEPGSSQKSWVVIAASQIDDETAMPPKFRPGGRHGGPGGPPPGAGGGPGGPPGAGGPPPGAGGPPQGGPGGHGPGGFGPPPPPLTAEQVGIIRAWIDQGAK